MVALQIALRCLEAHNRAVHRHKRAVGVHAVALLAEAIDPVVRPHQRLGEQPAEARLVGRAEVAPARVALLQAILALQVRVEQGRQHRIGKRPVGVALHRRPHCLLLLPVLLLLAEGCVEGVAEGVGGAGKVLSPLAHRCAESALDRLQRVVRLRVLALHAAGDTLLDGAIEPLQHLWERLVPLNPLLGAPLLSPLRRALP
mmetsp:Transcript_36779/g.109540  ORF Transcript_36779/g.109540 Transcript_36779/m.109540 type:complete len:201 (-) Transcript_36779:154-756(-)